MTTTTAAAVVEQSPQDDRSYRHVVLPNGLSALLMSDTTTDKASAALDVRVGHLSDPDCAPGLAHFLEHVSCYMDVLRNDMPLFVWRN